MKKFYCYFPIFTYQLEKLSWEHYVELMQISEVSTLYFYFRVALFCRSSVEELHYIICHHYYELI